MRLAGPNRAITLTALAALTFSCASLRADNSYVQHNLVSDVPGLAARTDARLVNAWGIDYGPTGPWWVNSNGKGLSLVLDANGNPFPPASPLVVTVPPPPGQPGPSKPTSVMFNSTSDFKLDSTHTATFLFATEDGTISAWNSMVNGGNPVIKINHAGSAIYKGAAIGLMGGKSALYAANFHENKVEVYDGSFSLITTLPATAFRDALIPSGFAPFNVQSIGGAIYVAFAKQDADAEDEVAGPGVGFVDKFSPEGALLMRLEHGHWMNAPWGFALAPGNFGKLSGMLLVGQFGSGQIAAFNPASGEFEGLMRGPHGKVVEIEGLWGIKFGNGATAGATNVLYFAAGIDDEDHGLFGTLTSTHPNGTDDDNDNE